MFVPSTCRPGAAIAIAALLIAGLAAPASASPWSDAWSRLAGWLAGTSFGAQWAKDSATHVPGNDGESRQSTQGVAVRGTWRNDSTQTTPVGKPELILSDEGIGVNPDGVPQP